MSLFFTADTHFGHKSAIDYCRRPFASVEEMDEQMIARWNQLVGPQDSVYHIGDLSFHRREKTEAILQQLNGHKYLIKGNHDHKKSLPRKGITHLGPYYELKMLDPVTGEKRLIVMCHFPIESWNQRHRGSWHLHGHCHGNLQQQQWHRRMDVGVDSASFMPYTFNEVRTYMNTRGFISVDHHEEANP